MASIGKQRRFTPSFSEDLMGRFTSRTLSDKDILEKTCLDALKRDAAAAAGGNAIIAVNLNLAAGGQYLINMHILASGTAVKLKD